MSEKPLNILVIQLTRIGDLVQTVQATRQFRNENPNIKLTLLAREKFGTNIKFLLDTVFDEIIFIDTKKFLSKPTLKDTKNKIHNFIYELNKKNFDVCVNLSFNNSASYIASLVDCQLRLGMHRNKQAEISINDNWSQFVFSNVMDNNLSPFNLVDIYRYILGCQETHVLNDDANCTRVNEITIHPFASQKKKKWGASKWSELIFKLIKDNPDYKINIVGAPSDYEAAQRILQSPSLKNYSKKIIDHTPSGDMTNTYKLLLNSKLFIGHDSVVAHLAAETLTPSLVLTLGTVKPFETNPYSNKTYNLVPRNKCFPCKTNTSCENLACHGSLNHQVVAHMAKGLLSGSEIDRDYLTSGLNAFQLDTLEVYKSNYSEYGLELAPIMENNMNASAVFKEYYKIIWQCFLRDLDLNVSLPEITKDTASQLYKYKDGVNYLYEIYNFGIKFSNKIISECESETPDLNTINENVKKLGELDQLCAITKSTYPYLSGIIDYIYTHKANSPGINLIDISKDNLISYYDASNLVAVISEFIEKSVSPYISTSQARSEEI